MRVIASYCELATLNLHMLTYICVGLRKNADSRKVSDGFRKFQMVLGFKFQVSDGFRKNKTLKTKTTFLKTIAITIAIAMSSGSGWKPVLLVTVGKCFSICLRIMVMLFTAGWKPVPHLSNEE